MTRNNADFNGINFSHKQEKYGGVTIEASHPEHGYLGSMRLSKYGEVKDVRVGEEHRRKGIATGMWNYAKTQGFNPEHSDSRTPEGDAWAATTGDHLPDNNGIFNPDAPNVWGS
jgi:hypothetical protein